MAADSDVFLYSPLEIPPQKQGERCCFSRALGFGLLYNNVFHSDPSVEGKQKTKEQGCGPLMDLDAVGFTAAPGAVSLLEWNDVI